MFVHFFARGYLLSMDMKDDCAIRVGPFIDNVDACFFIDSAKSAIRYRVN